MKKSVLILVASFLGIVAIAQTNSSKTVRNFDLSGAVGESYGSASLAYVHNWGLGKKKKFEIGFGVRFTSQFASNRYYETAPAKITTGSTGPGVLFKENIKANIDSFLLGKSQVNSLNVSINLGYNLSSKFYVGFNIDAIGFSFGSSKKGTYVNGTTIRTNESSKPTGFNALLISDNDRGSLNSEIFIKYKVSPKIWVRGGLQYAFMEYTTDNKVQTFPEANDRFRYKAGAFLFGVSYSL